ncbi:MAG: hypothetical protein IIY07_00940 [Thermoguttaceae bacterium]|nr:hypothetical protein [Thermoguttaceae bacterium]
MAKISVFLMSTLFIALCLWLNVYHYPDAPRGAAPDVSNDAPTDAPPPPAEPVSDPIDEKTDDQDSPSRGGLFADVAPAPELLAVSADPAATPPVLEPASFPNDVAEIVESPSKEVESAPRPATSPEKIPSEGPQAKPATEAPRPATSPEEVPSEVPQAKPALEAPRPAASPEEVPSEVPQAKPALEAPRQSPQTASPAVATPTQDLRSSATSEKPRGAKYVRVPEVEIDAFSGGVRSSRSTDDEPRVVDAPRAGQTTRIAPGASPAL